MSRDLTSNMLAAITADVVRPVILFEGEFETDWLRLWNGVGDLSWNGYTWLGAGPLITVPEIQETNDIKAAGVTVELSGLDGAIISLVLGEAQQGKRGTLYLAIVDDAKNVLDDPVILFQGKLDVPSIDDSGKECKVSITYENRLIDLERSRERRYTPEDQALDYPGDLGFEYVTELQDKNVVWGYPLN